MYPCLHRARGKAPGQWEQKAEWSSHGFFAVGTPASTEVRTEECKADFQHCSRVNV